MDGALDVQPVARAEQSRRPLVLPTEVGDIGQARQRVALESQVPMLRDQRQALVVAVSGLGGIVSSQRDVAEPAKGDAEPPNEADLPLPGQ